MMTWLQRLIVRVWRELLLTLDVLRPGWSEQAEPRHNEFGDPLSLDSLNYWLRAERARRIRD